MLGLSMKCEHVPHGSKSRSANWANSFATYSYVVTKSTMREPVSNRKLTVLASAAPLTCGFVTLNEKPRLVHALDTPKTAPSALNAASVPT